MTLVEAYAALGLEPALEFESRMLRDLRPPPGERTPALGPAVRGVGTTTRMLVMAALDAVDGKGVIVRVATRSETHHVRATLSQMVRKLDGDPRATGEIEVRLIAQPQPHPKGSQEVIYTDHFRDPLDGDDRRVLGPLGWAYEVRPNSAWTDSNLIYDRDNNLLGEVTDAGLKSLRERHCVALRRR